jgi:hypothetical protein
MKTESTFRRLSDSQLASEMEIARFKWQEAWDAARDPALSAQERRRWRKLARTLGHTKGRLHDEYERRQRFQPQVAL